MDCRHKIDVHHPGLEGVSIRRRWMNGETVARSVASVAVGCLQLQGVGIWDCLTSYNLIMGQISQ